MKLVLFGATGNIGRRLAREALARGHKVTAVVRDPAASPYEDYAIGFLDALERDEHSGRRITVAH